MNFNPIDKFKILFNKTASKLSGLLDEEKEPFISSPISKEHINNALDLHFFHNLLPYESYEDGVFYNDASHGFVLESSPITGCDEKMAKDLVSLFQGLLPEHSNLQCLLLASHRIGNKLESWESSCNSKKDVFKHISKRRSLFFEKVALDENNPARTFKVIMSYSMEGKIKTKIELENLMVLRRQLTSVLLGAGLNCKIWNGDDFVDFMGNFLFPGSNVKMNNQSYKDDELLSRQFNNPGWSFEIKKDNLVVNSDNNEKYVIKSFSPKKLPFSWTQHDMQNLIGDESSDIRQIPCDFCIHYGIHVLPDSVSTTKLLKASRIESQANSPMRKVLPLLVKEADEWGFVRKRIADGDKFISTSYGVTLFCKEEGLINAEQRLLSLYKSNGFELQVDRLIQLPSFLSIFPMSFGNGWHEKLQSFNRTKTALSYEPANLMPLQGEWTGTHSEGMLLTGRRGQVFSWCSFDNDHGNYNTCVVGTSGSGKSVFMQELMVSTLRLGGRVFVLDVGRSFEKSCHMLGGSFLCFDEHSPLCINPFSLISDDPKRASESLSFFKPVLSMMAAPKDGTTDKQNALLEQALIATWEKFKQKNTIDDIAKWLLTHKDMVAKDLGEMLFPYTKNGSYGRFFYGENNVDLTNDLVVIEFEELKERKDLQSVIVQIMVINISNQMFLGDRKTPFNIVFDEAWDMLRGKTTGLFIETLARRLRKYNGALVVGTQSVNDFFASAGARAALDNSDWLCFLRQKQESINALKNHKNFELTPSLARTLSSISTKKGKYSEVCIKGVDGYGVGRLKLDPYSLLLYSTDKADYAAVKDKEAEGFNLAEAMEEVLKERGVR